MKLIYIVLGILVVAAVAVIVWKLFQKTNSSPHVQQVNISTSDDSQSESPYFGLRSMALDTPANQFGIENNATNPVVYGVVMDWNVGKGVITFAAFSSGDASMYTSSGGGVIGGGGNEQVRDSAKGFVSKGREFVAKARKSDDSTVPGENGVKFFILTTQGRFVASERLENFDDGSSEWLELFVEANKLITELRKVSEEPRNEDR